MAAAASENTNILPAMNMIDSVQTLFGVELEMCVRIEEGCIPFDSDISSRTSSEKFNLYFEHVLKPNWKYINEKHDFIIFEDDVYVKKYFKNGTIEPASSADIAAYTAPFFYIDISVVCGDSSNENRLETWNEKKGRVVEKNKSFAIECVTPILSIMGESTKEKIQTELLPYLYFFGLLNPACFMSNYSSGFHVNVSLKNKTTREIIPITKFRQIIFRHLVPYELRRYSEVRTRRPIPNMNKELYESVWAQPTLHFFEKAFSEVSKSKLPEDKKKQLFIKIMNELKYYENKLGALKIKKDHVLEYRLYQSETDPDLLINYTSEAIELTHAMYRDFVLLSNTSSLPNDYFDLSSRILASYNKYKNMNMRKNKEIVYRGLRGNYSTFTRRRRNQKKRYTRKS